MEIRLSSFQNAKQKQGWIRHKFTLMPAGGASGTAAIERFLGYIHLQRLLRLLTAVYSWFNCAVKELAVCYY